MTINTFEFSKGIIIVIVYNMIILTSIKCNDNLTVRDYDTKLIVNGNTSYFDYHFRSAQNPGQLKISPIGYFSSIYNCPYTVLPEVSLECGGYTEYILKLNELVETYHRKLKDGFKDITELKNQESNYVSNVKQAEHDSIEKRTKGTCYALSETEYYDVILMYHTLPDPQDTYEIYEKFFFNTLELFEYSFENATTRFNEREAIVGRMRDPRKVESYKSTFNKLKSKFVVNNENYMSYLVRLKKQGSVGFHQIYHTSMYKIRKNNYYPGNYIIDMDIHKEDFESELDQLKPMEEIPIENINLT